MTSSSTYRAIGYALIGYTFWVIGDTFMKLASEQTHALYQVMGVGGVGGLLSIFLVTKLRGDKDALRPKHYKPLIALGIMFLLNYAVWLTALSRLPLANFYTVMFLAPTVSSIFAMIFLNENLTIKKALAIIAGFIGIVIAVNPTHLMEHTGDWLGYGVSFLGMLVIVAQMLTMRSIANRISRESAAFYPRIAAVLGSLVAVAIWGYEPMSAKALTYSILTGMIGGMGWMFMAHAYKFAPTSTISAFHYSQIIIGAFFGYVIWHDIPTPQLLIGATIIIASGLYIMSHARKTELLTSTIVETP